MKPNRPLASLLIAIIPVAATISAVLLHHEPTADRLPAAPVTNCREKPAAHSKVKPTQIHEHGPSLAVTENVGMHGTGKTPAGHVPSPTTDSNLQEEITSNSQVSPRSPARSAGKSVVEQRSTKETAPHAEEVATARLSDISDEEEPTTADTVGVAVQLADDVRLPAALLPMEGVVTSPEMAAATVGIAQKFYNELLRRAYEDPASLSKGPSPTGPVEAGNAEIPAVADTTMVQSTPTVEKARWRADELFRALYGNDKYNQQLIYSALEVQLPIVPSAR